jgi:hypothetical protein
MPDIIPGGGGFVLRIPCEFNGETAGSGTPGEGCHAAIFMDK